MSSYGGAVLLDMSAWGRVLLDRVAGEARERYEEAVRQAEVCTCEPFLLEALYSAREDEGYRRLAAQLAALPRVSGGPATMRRALAAQAELASTPGVSHRVKPIDLLLAATAEEHRLGVLHYDRDYDVIASHSGMMARSVWIAPRGSMP
ncbi:MAG: PIN domain-containing protein [Solirubrobacteraceae bacterium MAG38_C4-C5]|nr:PIN domain-containing protein [Candidatus Siliceabacter maunaloa]